MSQPPPRSTLSSSAAASDVDKRQNPHLPAPSGPLAAPPARIPPGIRRPAADTASCGAVVKGISLYENSFTDGYNLPSDIYGNCLPAPPGFCYGFLVEGGTTNHYLMESVTRTGPYEPTCLP